MYPKGFVNIRQLHYAILLEVIIGKQATRVLNPLPKHGEILRPLSNQTTSCGLCIHETKLFISHRVPSTQWITEIEAVRFLVNRVHGVIYEIFGFSEWSPLRKILLTLCFLNFVIKRVKVRLS